MTLIRLVSVILLAFTSMFPLTSNAAGATRPDLSAMFPAEKLRELLPPPGAWKPFATRADRDFWTGIPEAAAEDQIARAEKTIGQPWPELPATLYMEFAVNGNRRNYEDPYFERRNRLADLVSAECIEAQGRFTDEIVNGLWLIMEETSWVIPAHIGAQKAGRGLPDNTEPVVDLFSAETASLVAWTVYLLGDELDKVSPLVTGRCRREIQQRVLDPNLERDDFWWLGFEADHVNNWNPWVNSNWLSCILLIEQDSGKRAAAVAKIMRSLDVFIDSYHDDGGCDEGPSYWGRAGASLFDCLEWLYNATGGEIDVYSYPLIQNMGRYIYRAHIADRWFINFADASARVGISSELVWRYGRRIGDSLMEGFGAWAASESGVGARAPGDYLSRRLWMYMNMDEIAAAEGKQPYVRDVWLDGTQVFAARSRAGSTEGLYLAAKGGHNKESHNHNDVGNFIVYYNGHPALVDAGVGVYTAKTFSDQRYDIWTMQSAYHNLPTVNGAMQLPGLEYAARDVKYKAGGSSASLSMELAGAYGPEAGINSWKRDITLRRGKEVRVRDRFSLSKRGGDLMMSLLTPCRVTTVAPGELRLDGGSTGSEFSLKVSYDKDLTPVVETIELDDARLEGSWGERLYRVTLKAADDSPKEDTWMLSVGN